MIYNLIFPDGVEKVDIKLGDKMRAEQEMQARGLGRPSDSPVGWLTLAAWRSALRTKNDRVAKFETFEDFTNAVENLTAADEGDDTDPFNGAA